MSHIGGSMNGSKAFLAHSVSVHAVPGSVNASAADVLAAAYDAADVSSLDLEEVGAWIDKYKENPEEATNQLKEKMKSFAITSNPFRKCQKIIDAFYLGSVEREHDFFLNPGIEKIGQQVQLSGGNSL
ncbi:hypothetical protein LINGRAHAP2_LOCUS12885 [Linum grandiflorum]